MENGLLPGHSTRHCVPGVEVSAGALGHGLSMAAGMAYVGKKEKKDYRVFAILSDGECDEGSTWEAILFSGHQNNRKPGIYEDSKWTFCRTSHRNDFKIYKYFSRKEINTFFSLSRCFFSRPW